MPLKAKIANKVKTEENGLTIGEIIAIEEIEEHTEKEGKKEVLKSVLNTGKFKTADMYDDDARNLDAFLSLKTNDVKLAAYIVKEGHISTY